jgi:hypothetical protein
MVACAIFDIVGRRRLNVGVMPEERIIAPFFGFVRPGNSLELTPDEFAQGDAQPPGMGFGAGPQILGEKNRRAMHIHILGDMDMAVKTL